MVERRPCRKQRRPDMARNSEAVRHQHGQRTRDPAIAHTYRQCAGRAGLRPRPPVWLGLWAVGVGTEAPSPAAITAARAGPTRRDRPVPGAAIRTCRDMQAGASTHVAAGPNGCSQCSRDQPHSEYRARTRGAIRGPQGVLRFAQGTSTPDTSMTARSNVPTNLSTALPPERLAPRGWRVVAVPFEQTAIDDDVNPGFAGALGRAPPPSLPLRANEVIQ
jgi:hypothetical protein